MKEKKYLSSTFSGAFFCHNNSLIIKVTYPLVVCLKCFTHMHILYVFFRDTHFMVNIYSLDVYFRQTGYQQELLTSNEIVSLLI